METELGNGADVNGAENSDFNSPLHLAIEHNGRPDIVELLLERGANPNASGYRYIAGHHGDDGYRSHRSPLQLAVEQYDRPPSIVQLLLEYGADPNPNADYDNSDESPLFYASRLWYRGDREIIALLLEHGADLNAKSGSSGSRGVSPLHRAIFEADSDLIELLLDHGADIHARTDRQNYGGGGRYATPLHLAAEAHVNPVSIATLIEHGAEVNAKTADGATPLHLASSSNPYYGGFSEEASLEVVALLLDHSADVNARDYDGRTPLHWATDHSLSYALVELLLEHGADVNASNERGGTPLHGTVSSSAFPEEAVLAFSDESGVNETTVAQTFARVVSLLLAHGADINARNQHGETPCQMSRTMFRTFEAPPEVRDQLCQ